MNSFPRIRRRAVPGGEVVETDSGMFITTKTSVTTQSATFADMVEAIAESIQSVVPPDPKVTVTRIREEARRVAGMADQPDGMREDARKIASLCDDLESYVEACDLASAVQLSLQIGRLWGVLDCRTLEPEIIKRRNSIEATRGPRKGRVSPLLKWLRTSVPHWQNQSPKRLWKLAEAAGHAKMSFETFVRSVRRMKAGASPPRGSKKRTVKA